MIKEQSIHDVLKEIIETGWLGEEEGFVLYFDMSLALYGESEGFPMPSSPEEVMDEAFDLARLNAPERAYYRERFARAYEAYVEALVADVVAAA